MEKAFTFIPKEILPSYFAKEDNIVFYEAYKLSTKVGFVEKAVLHQDPRSLRIVWHKNRAYGKDMHDLLRTGHYSGRLS